MIDASTLSAWQFNETTGTNGRDTLRLSRDLAQVAALATPTTTTARIGLAFAFNGTSQIIGYNMGAADQNIFAGEVTLAVVFRLASVGASTSRVLFRAGGGTASAAANQNEVFCLRIVRDALATDAPLLNLRWESGTNVAQPNSNGASLASVPLLVGQTYVVHAIKKWNGVNYDMQLAVNGRIYTVATNLPATGSGVLLTDGTCKITFGAAHNGASIDNPLAVQVCSAVLSSRAYAQADCVRDFRRVAGMALPTSVSARVKLADQSDNMIDVTTIGGNLLAGLNVTDDADAPCASASIELAGLSGDTSTAHLRGDSVLNDPTLAGTFDPFLDVFRRVDIEFARVPCWTEPVTIDWWLRFRGRTDTVDDAGDRARIQCRDQGAFLADKYMDELIVYPKTFGGGGCGGSAQAREIVVEEMLQANLAIIPFAPFNERSYFDPALPAEVAGTNTAVWVPFPSASCVVPQREGDAPNIRDVPQPRGRLLDALRQASNAIGWDTRFKFDPLSESFRPCFFNPQRTKTAPDVSVGVDDIVALSGSRRSIEDVRNVVRVTIADNTKKDDMGNRLPTSIIRRDTDNGHLSRAKYGTRPIDITEDASSSINTNAEAVRMADAIVNDYAMPWRDVSIDIMHAPELEVGDLVLLNEHDSTSTTFTAIQSLSISHTANDQQTTIDCQGQPTAGRKRTFVTAEIGKVAGMTPRNAGEAIKIASSKTNLAAVGAAINRSSFLGDTPTPLQNGNFTRQSRGTDYEPDGWAVRNGTEWIGLPTDRRVSTTPIARSGDRALLFQRSSVDFSTSPEITSQQMVAIDGDPNAIYSFEMVWQLLSPLSTAPRPPGLRLDWYDSNRSLISSADPGWTSGVHLLPLRADASYLWTARNFETFSFPAGVIGVGGIAADTWFTSRVEGVRPPSSGAARYLAVTPMAVEPITVAAPTTEINDGGFVVDTVKHWRTKQSLRARPSANQAIVVDTWHNIRFDEANLIGGFFDRGNGHVAVVWPGAGYGFRARRRGRYRVSLTAVVTSGSNTSTAKLRIVSGATYLITNGALNVAGQELLSGLAVKTNLTGKEVGGTGGGNFATVSLDGVVLLDEGQIITAEVINTANGGTIINPANSNTIAQTWTSLSVDLIDDI
mgnify:CR=1 FL=1